MRPTAFRVRSASVVVIAALASATVALGGTAVAQFNSSFADPQVRATAEVADNIQALGTKTFLLDCSTRPINLPTQYSIACSDENTVLKDLTWKGWGSAQASASGTYSQNTCTPDCAHGIYVNVPVALLAHGLERKAGTAIYTKITLSFTSTAPPSVANAAGIWDVSPEARRNS